MADYDWGPFPVGEYATRDWEERARAVRAQARLDALKDGYVMDNVLNQIACARCGCVVSSQLRGVHNSQCPWTEEMFQTAMDQLGDL